MDKIIAYKITDTNGCCRGVKYEVGKTYTHKGAISICESGFHASINPLDCMRYHNVYNSKFWLVECGGKIEQQEDKICCSTLKIIQELTLTEFVNAAFTVIWLSGNAAASGFSGNASASGERGNAAASGERAIAAAIGLNGKAKISKNSSWLVIADVRSDGSIKRVVAKRPGNRLDGKTIEVETWYWFEDGVLHSQRDT